jgi:peptide/nickel transport system permease protein
MSEDSPIIADETVPDQSASFGRRLTANPLGLTGLIIVATLIAASICSALGWVPFDPIEQHPVDRLTGPSRTYWFGTDQFGRDVFSRVLAGLRLSFQVAFLAVAIAATIGTALGVLAGFLGKWVDAITMRVADVLFAFPAILLALIIVAVLGAGWFNAAIAIAVVYTPVFIRVSRGPTLQVKSADYIRAGVGLGFSTPRLIFRHVLPNIASVVIVQITLSLSWAILTESTLSFLGLGTQPPDASLGLMVSASRAFASIAWWTLFFPSLAIALAVLGLNLLGDGLRDTLDPSRRDS